MRKLHWGPRGLRATTWGPAFTLGLVACAGQSTDESFARVHHDLNAAAESPAALQAGATCDQLLGRLQSELLNQVSERAKQARVSNAAYFGGGVFIDDVLPPSLVVASTSARVSSERPPSSGPFSGTTLQAPGLDEADFVKTDGDRIYVLQGRNLVVLNAASPDSTEILATVPLEGNGAALYVHDGRVVVFSNYYGPVPGAPEINSPYYYYYPTYTVQTVVDATSSGFDVLRESYFEASYLNSRRDGNVVHAALLQSSKAQLDYPNVSYVDIFGHPRSQAEIDVQVDLWVLLATESIEDSAIEDYVPASFERVNGALVQQPLHCEDYLNVEPRSNSNFTPFGTTSVIGLDLGDIQAPIENSTVLGYADSVVIGKDSALLRLYDYSQYTDTNPTVSTSLHRFGFDGANSTYTASAHLVGDVQSFDEFNGAIRASVSEYSYTTDADAGGGLTYAGTTSRIVTFGVADGELTELGRSQDVASSQGVNGTQFFGDRGYQLRATDTSTSFVVLDLADPAAPTFAGEVPFLGYTNLLYPLSSEVLLGVGQSYDTADGSTSTNLRLYDVRDANAPRVAQEYTLPDSGYTDAFYDPHALTFYPSRNLLAFPYQTNDGISGLEVFRTSIAQGFTRLGRVVPPPVQLSLIECLQILGYSTDPEFLQQIEDDPTFKDQLLLQCNSFTTSYVRRGLLRDNAVYAVSSQSVAAYALDALDGPPQSQVQLPIDNYYYAPIDSYYYYRNPLSPVPASAPFRIEGGSAE